jgi:hypothetical protein
MKVAIMQPYFLPYIGYFQLIGAVDAFVLYDNIKYTKKGWINRNRYLLNDGPADFVIPIRKDSDSLNVRDRQVAEDFDPGKLLNRLRQAYRKAPHARVVLPLLDEILRFPDRNLFGFIHHSLAELCRLLEIKTRIIVSSTLEVDHSLKSRDKVLAICGHLGADTYINAIGGVRLYSPEDFSSHGIDLRFIHPRSIRYPQLGGPFVPWLSILDVLMFNSGAESMDLLTQFDLVGLE